MNIAGIVVRSRPETLSVVRRQLESLTGCEIHAATDDGRMVVTIENPEDRKLSEHVMQVETLPGVVSASLIYHHFDEIAASQLED